MIAGSVVVPLQIVSGRLKQAIFALLLSTGAVVGFVDLMTGSRKFTGGVGKVRMFYGVRHSKCL